MQNTVVENFEILCDFNEDRTQTRFIVIADNVRWTTKFFSGKLSLEAAQKAWKHQRHLFTMTSNQTNNNQTPADKQKAIDANKNRNKGKRVSKSFNAK